MNTHDRGSIEHSRRNIRVHTGSVDARFFGDHFAIESSKPLTARRVSAILNALSALLTSFWSVGFSSRTTTCSRSQSFG
jgi:hypothetical protein